MDWGYGGYWGWGVGLGWFCFRIPRRPCGVFFGSFIFVLREFRYGSGFVYHMFMSPSIWFNFTIL